MRHLIIIVDNVRRGRQIAEALSTDVEGFRAFRFVPTSNPYSLKGISNSTILIDSASQILSLSGEAIEPDWRAALMYLRGHSCTIFRLEELR